MPCLFRPVVLLSGLALPALALAAPDGQLPDEEPAPEVRYAAETELDFQELSVEAQLARPAGSFVQGHRRAEFAPMIQLRTSFDVEMVESVDIVR